MNKLDILACTDIVPKRMSSLFKCTWNIYAGHKRSFNKFQRIEISQSTFSDHRKLSCKSIKKKNFSNAWKFSNTLLNRSRKKISMAIGKYL